MVAEQRRSENGVPPCTDGVGVWDPSSRFASRPCPDGRFATARGTGRLALDMAPEPSALVLAGERFVVGTTEGEVLVVDATARSSHAPGAASAS